MIGSRRVGLAQIRHFGEALTGPTDPYEVLSPGRLADGSHETAPRRTRAVTCGIIAWRFGWRDAASSNACPAGVEHITAVR